jgi:YfiR/HmsC-like
MGTDAVHRSSRSMNAAAAILGLLAISFYPSLARSAEFSEDVVKAAYLYRFAGYIEWPARASTETPFTIDVLGAPGIAQELRRLLPGHPINGRAAQVREITGNRDLGNAQIVYIAAGHADLVRTLVPQSSDASMLVVTDEDGGLSAGSTLNFLTIDRNVRFEVSLSAAERWRLRISSELLGVAIRVQGRTSQSYPGCGPVSDVDSIHGPCGPRVANQERRVALSSPVPKG